MYGGLYYGESYYGDGPSGDTIIPPSGGGGEWVSWDRPSFPGNRPGAFSKFPPPNFRQPTRREQKGY